MATGPFSEIRIIETETVNRRLSAILMADVVGYSRLMGADEDDTIARLITCRVVFSTQAESFDGRIVNAPGDSILAEFQSVHRAVECAVAIQVELERLNAEIPEDRKMRFRIGINLGDVVTEEGAIYGNGVNVAARLESLADPGGVTVSGSVYDSVVGRLPFDFEPTGEQSVKNIARPVSTYRVVFEGALPGPSKQLTEPKRRPFALWVFGAMCVLLIATIGNLYDWKPADKPRGQLSTSPDGKPSVAIFPFRNNSQDPDQSYFSDGLTETLSTALADLRDMTVVGASVTSVYAKEDRDIRDIGRDLGTRHVLTGGVQKTGERIRITARLIDVESGQDIWSEKYDQTLTDIFAIQDKITREILAALDIALVEGEQARNWRSSTNNPEAYELFLKGWAGRERINQLDNARARRFFEQALALDPEFTAALFGLGSVHMAAAYSGWTDSPAESYETALDFAKRAIDLDPSFGGAYDLYGEVLIMHRQENEEGLRYMRQAVEKAPGSARYNLNLGVYLCNTALIAEGLNYVKRGFDLNPHPPAWFHQAYGRCYLLSGRYKESIAAHKKAVAQLPDFIWSNAELVVAYMEIGESELARQHAREVLRIDPEFSAESHPAVTIISSEKLRSKFTNRLREAGIP